MDVKIVEASTETLVIIYPVVLNAQNYKPSENEYFNEAWRCAVEDKLVTPDRRNEYRIAFL